MDYSVKRKKSKKILLFIFIAIIIVLVLVGWGIKSQNHSVPDSADTKTLSQGTQMRFDGLNIALGSVSENSAWLIVHKDGENEDVKKSVVKGDVVNAYGYTIEIKSVKESANPSILPGSSHGSIKFIIKKNN